VKRFRGYAPAVWPTEVERVAAVFREAGLEARLEELAEGEAGVPGTAILVEAFECDGRIVVALAPSDRPADPWRLGCSSPRRIAAPMFPFRGASVTLDQSLLGEASVWLEAGSPRHFVCVAPGQLAQLVGAQVADVSADERGARGSAEGRG
jgi:hypothetical protein